MENNNIYDVIIIGLGMAGLGSTIYAKRFGLKTLVIGELQGGTITKTHLVENYPGYKSISGFELGMKLYEHAQAVEAEIKSSNVKEIKKLEDGKFEVEIGNGDKFTTYAVVIATGLKHRELEVPGEEEYKNKGVSYCATCDGPFFRDKKVVVVGGGDSAFKEAIFLSNHASDVTIMYRGPEERLRPEPINAERVAQNAKITVMVNTEIKEVKGDSDKVTEFILNNGETFKADGVFVEIGGFARSEFAEKLGCALDSKKQIIIDRYSKTNVDGVFAAGDVTDSEWKQGVICAAEGAAAAYSVFSYVNSVKN